MIRRMIRIFEFMDRCILCHLLGFFYLVRMLFSYCVVFLEMLLTPKELYIWLLALAGMLLTATSIWEVIKFSYSSFGVCLSDVSWRLSNLFLTFNEYWFLKSQLAREEQLCFQLFAVRFLFLHRQRWIFAETILWSEETHSKKEYAS